MYIADRVHRFECLPALTVSPRWDMLEMAAMEKAFQAGIDSLRQHDRDVQHTKQHAKQHS
ncbi:hypothetical protein F444_04448 [Phytophthora nicotianae P1976]|uniref:Uncharacterized protein n=1 Tax=Phytophthora nicotianae P1976 TaxID=1317066 RepID=A0A081AQM5_PHYNI|nr:hypothetical protein F444_04448 [Phytophthora nicotianae P1976]